VKVQKSSSICKRNSFEFLIYFLELNTQINTSCLGAKKEIPAVDLINFVHIYEGGRNEKIFFILTE